MAVGEVVIIFTQGLPMVGSEDNHAVIINSELFETFNQSGEVFVKISYFTVIFSDIVMVIVMVPEPLVCRNGFFSMSGGVEREREGFLVFVEKKTVIRGRRYV